MAATEVADRRPQKIQGHSWITVKTFFLREALNININNNIIILMLYYYWRICIIRELATTEVDDRTV